MHRIINPNSLIKHENGVRRVSVTVVVLIHFGGSGCGTYLDPGGK